MGTGFLSIISSFVSLHIFLSMKLPSYLWVFAGSLLRRIGGVGKWLLASTWRPVCTFWYGPVPTIGRLLRNELKMFLKLCQLFLRAHSRIKYSWHSSNSSLLCAFTFYLQTEAHTAFRLLLQVRHKCRIICWFSHKIGRQYMNLVTTFGICGWAFFGNK